jgi:TRAP transporter TAXI family solute receptor
MKKFALSFIIFVFIGFLPLSALALDVNIATGGIQGVYYPTGVDICGFVNAVPEYDINCEALLSSGSIENINNVINGLLEFAIVQSDFQYDAWNGLGIWAGNPQPKLRAVFSIHNESVTLVTAFDTGIRTIYDLEGKKVNLGPEGSGGLQNAIDILTFAGIDKDKDLHPNYYNLTNAATEFQNGNLDALFITVGHPNEYIETLVNGKRKVYFVPLNLSGFIDDFPYYAASIIPIKYYNKAKNNKDIPTFGVKATFITSSDVENEIVYAFTKEVLGNFSDFQQLHPTRNELIKNDMLKELTAPIHDGAIKYYKEVIFIKTECDK